MNSLPHLEGNINYVVYKFDTIAIERHVPSTTLFRAGGGTEHHVAKRGMFATEMLINSSANSCASEEVPDTLWH